MPSAVLLQEPREEARLAKDVLRVSIVSVESAIDSISLSAPEKCRRGSEPTPFDFDVYLSESARTEDRMSVRYSFTFGRPFSGQVCKVSGTATVRFSGFDPSRDFHALGDDVANEMAVEIFRRDYTTVYLLHEALAMEAPSPWITRQVSLSSRSSVYGVGPSGAPQPSLR
ncbi:MAG: hypothetical protein ACRD6W_02180 [Nitrososphaerales archaeon]